jgi:hypothetical protein
VDRVHRIFARQSAYAYVKDLLPEHDLMDAWHEFEKKETENMRRQWCRANDITVFVD